MQIKSDIFLACMGGAPNADWTNLKISTTEHHQSSQIHPMLDDSGVCEQSKGLDTKFSKEKETCLGSNVYDSSTSKTWEYIPQGSARSHQDGESPHGSHPVHSGLCQDCHPSSMTPTVVPNDHSACYALLDLKPQQYPGQNVTDMSLDVTYHCQALTTAGVWDHCTWVIFLPSSLPTVMKCTATPLLL